MTEEKNGDKIKKIYTPFEVAMSEIFFDLYRLGTVEALEKQIWWNRIQELKKMAQDEET